MKGKWIKHVPAPHQCYPPIGRFGIGSIWQCECGKDWLYTNATPKGATTIAVWKAK